MKILWAKSGGFLPVDTGGRIRSFRIASELARRHEVTMFTFYPTLTPDPHDELREPFDRIESMPLELPERSSVRELVAYATNTLTRQPYQMRKYCRPQVRQRLSKLLSEGQYDVLVCDFLVTAGVVPWNGVTPTVIFTHNVEAVIWRRHFEVSKNPLWKLVAWRECKTIARAERHFTKLADHVLTVSDVDRKTFLEYLPERKVTTVPTGVDLEYFSPSSRPSKHASSLVFTGSMDWMPNEDAIIYFTAEILPRIQERIPNVTLCVAGRKPTRRLRALKERHPALQVTGTVDDIRPYISEAAVYVVPLRIGGGTRIKIFEAMAMGMPVISTSIGAEGLPVEHGHDILLADTPAEFADHVVDLLTQQEKRERIGRAARSLVESRYDWTSVTNVVEQALHGVARPRGLQNSVRVFNRRNS